MRFLKLAFLLILILLTETLSPKPAIAGQATSDENFGGIRGAQVDALHSAAKAGGAHTDVTADFTVSSVEGGFAVSMPSNSGQAGNGQASGAAYNPDTDPAFQRATRGALASNDDPLMWGKNFLKARSKDYIYSLLDTCATIDNKKKATTCRTQQKCTTDNGEQGVNLDVVVGETGSPHRSPRGTQMCITNAVNRPRFCAAVMRGAALG